MRCISAEAAKGLKTNRIDFAKAPMRGSPWKFERRGQSGMEISELFPHIGSKADEIALIRSCYGEAFDHAPAIYLRNTGSQFPGQPCLGSWVVYGLGIGEPEPPRVCRDDRRRDEVGAAGVCVRFPAGGVSGDSVSRRSKYPVLNLGTPEGVSAKAQRATLDFINEQDQRHLEPRSYDSELEARIASYELAYRMQSSAPEAVDLGKESEATKKLYGIGQARHRRLRTQVPAGAPAGRAWRALRAALLRHEHRRGLGRRAQGPRGLAYQDVREDRSADRRAC